MKKSLWLAASSIAVGVMSLAVSVNAGAAGVVGYYSTADPSTAYVQNSDTTQKRAVRTYTNGTSVWDIFLSADGTRAAIAAMNTSGENIIDVVDTATNNVISSTTQANYNLIDISPDGNSLLISNNGVFEIVPVTGTGATAVQGVLAGMYFSAFSPDGQTLIGSYGQIDTTDIIKLNWSTGSYTALTAGVAGTSSARSYVSTVSYDGTIQYLQTGGNFGDAITSYTMNIDGTGSALTANSGTDLSLTFSPDGTEVLYAQAAAPMTVTGGGAIEDLAVLQAARNQSGAVAYFTAASWDWAGGNLVALPTPPTPPVTEPAPEPAPAPAPAESPAPASTLASTGSNMALIALVGMALMGGATRLAYKSIK